MASAGNHPPFPSRPYTSNLSSRPNQYNNPPYQSNTPYAPPPQQQPQPAYNPQPQPTNQQREAARHDALHNERLARERREAEAQQTLESLNEEQREEINEAFGLFDLDKDAHIDYHEFKVALKALGFDLPKTEILGMMQEFGIPASAVHGNGKAPARDDAQQPNFLGPGRLLLPHAAFVNLAAQRIHARDPKDEILRAFDLFDMDGKGRIELEDLRRVARELGEGLQDEELVAMIEEFDVRGEGGIDREGFLGICLGT